MINLKHSKNKWADLILYKKIEFNFNESDDIFGELLDKQIRFESLMYSSVHNTLFCHLRIL